jgi:hypothetical protein
VRDKAPRSYVGARAAQLHLKMQLYARIFAAAMLAISSVEAAEHSASEAADESEEIMVSEHPPVLVYYRSATRSPSRIARQALRTYCRERASQKDASGADPEKRPAIAHFCMGARSTILMGVNYRDEFNKTLYVCRADLDLRYVAYPLYWRDTFGDTHWCARVEYDHEGRRYRVTE